MAPGRSGDSGAGSHAALAGALAVLVAALPALAAALPVLAWPSTVAGQPESTASDPERVPRLAADAPLTLRPTEATRALARRVSRTLGLRLDVPVAVGEDAPPEILEAVPAGHLGLGRRGDEVVLVLAGPAGQVYRSEVSLGAASSSASARAVALAIEALRDAALEGPPPGTAQRRTYTVDGGREVTWYYRPPSDGPLGPRRRVEALAKPTLQLGFLAGLSTERMTALLGPRLGLGLCLDETCVLLEADLPVLPDESRSCDGRRIRYRPVNLSLRLLLRPFVVGDLSFGFGFGLLTRFGTADLVGVEASRLATDFGLRSNLEAAWRFAGPFELVLEAGADIHTSPAVFVRATRPPPGDPAACAMAIERILVEDIVTVWSVLAVRLRP